MNIRPSDGPSNACRNVLPAWTETSYSYSVCRDVNTHTGIERCVMYRSSFRTFPSFLNPREHSAHNTWTTFWSFRSFFKQNAVLFHIVNNYYVMEVFIPIFYIYPKRNILFECMPINFDFIVHSQFVTKSFLLLSKRFIKKHSTHENRIGIATFLQGET